jgi:hypothetical protein
LLQEEWGNLGRFKERRFVEARTVIASVKERMVETGGRGRGIWSDLSLIEIVHGENTAI